VRETHLERETTSALAGRVAADATLVGAVRCVEREREPPPSERDPPRERDHVGAGGPGGGGRDARGCRAVR
jgi:hypothetical protein